MKFIRFAPIAALLYVLFLSGSATLTSCTKDNDTTIIRDTIIIKDTVTVKDTTCRLYAGLVGYYNFTNGNLNDSSGTGNDIIFNNAVKTTDRFGRPDNAYLFNGSSSYMQIKHSSMLNPKRISLVAMFKVNGYYQGLCHANQIFGKGNLDGGNGVWCLRFHDLFNDNCSAAVDTATQFMYGAYGNNILSTTTTSSATTGSYFINTGKWYTVVYTYDGVDSKIYVNGELKGSQHTTATFTDNTNDVFIGKTGNTNYPYWFNGVIDELRIYSRALNENEVKQLSLLTK
jgi:hypothetical protein